MQSKRNLFTLVMTGALIVITLFSSVQAQDKNIKEKDLPGVITKSFKDTYPKAIIIGTSIEVEDGKKMYEIESKDDDLRRDLLYTERGEVFVIEESVVYETLPETIKAALEKRFKKYKFKKGEKVIKGTTVEYELVIKSGKKVIAVVLDSNGKIIKSNAAKERKEKKETDENEEKVKK
jgi:hypothetical protein